MFKQAGRHWEYNLIHPIPALALIGWNWVGGVISMSCDA